MKIEVNNQSEMDAIALDFKGEIHIIGKLDRVDKYYPNAIIYVYGSAQIRNVYGSAQIRNVSGSAQINDVSGSAQINDVYGSAQINDVSGSAQISYVSGSAQIRNVSGSAQINDVYGSAQIRNVSGSAQIRNVSGSAQISYVSGSAQINDVYGSAQINDVSGSAQISYVSGSAQISYVYGSAQIRNVYGSAQINYVYGSATILHIDGNAKVACQGKNIISYYNDKSVILDLSKETTIVILDRFNATFKAFQETYPCKVEGNNVILYKALHKKEGKYFADYNPKFEYKIGETQTEICDPSTTESCKSGIHVSHRMWALNFGRSWSDMALLEFEVPIDKIVVALDCDGKIRTSSAKCIREIPKEDWYK